MPTPRQFTNGLLVIAGVVVVAFGASVLTGRPRTDGATPTAAADDPARGATQPTVTVIEYGDFQCEFCRTSADALASVLAQTAVPVRHIWKDAPHDSHDQALPAAVAARCAHQQGAFWPFHDRLFQDQAALSAERFRAIAIELGLEAVAFGECLADPAVAERVRASGSEARQFRVTDLPTLFINGRRVTGALTATSLRAIIEAEAAAAPS